MATLKDAERAREQTAEYLRRLGAHAVSVEEEPSSAAEPARPRAASTRADPGEGDGPRTTNPPTTASSTAATSAAAPRPRKQARRFAVVAWFDGEPPADLPDRLEVIAGKATRVVPLRGRREERFQAEYGNSPGRTERGTAPDGA